MKQIDKLLMLRWVDCRDGDLDFVNMRVVKWKNLVRYE
jgi:hypothetical protein